MGGGGISYEKDWDAGHFAKVVKSRILFSLCLGCSARNVTIFSRQGIV